MRGLDAHLTAGPPVDLAWERWAESAIIGDRCEVMAPLGNGLLATIEHATDLDVTVRTDTVAHGRTWAWCPADTAALLEVAHDLGAVRPELMRRVGGGWRCDAQNLDPEPVTNETAPRTARLAALRLLASVST